MTKAEEIVQKILAARRDLGKNEVQKLIEEKVRSTDGLLSEEGAARLLAQELHISVESGKMEEIYIADLIPGLDDVTIVARVIIAWPIREFKRANGTSGKLMRLSLADNSGKIVCVVWNDRAEEISRIKSLQGKAVEIHHAYTREGPAGVTELQIGERGRIAVCQVLDKRLPELSDFLIKISEVTPEKKFVNITGIVNSDPALVTFEKEGEKGSVLRIRISDEAGDIGAVVWDEKAEELKNLKKGAAIQIMNGRVKQDAYGFSEIHVDGGTQVTVLEKNSYSSSLARSSKISDLRPGQKKVDLLVRVVTVGRTTFRGFLKNSVTRLLVNDETGMAEVSVWNGAIVRQIKKNDIILVRDATAKEWFGRLLITVNRPELLLVNPKLPTADTIPLPTTTQVARLSKRAGVVIVEGTIVEAPVFREAKNSNTDDVARLVLADGTGRVEVSLWGDLAQTVRQLGKGVRLRIYGLRTRLNSSGRLHLSSGYTTVVDILDRHD